MKTIEKTSPKKQPKGSAKKVKFVVPKEFKGKVPRGINVHVPKLPDKGLSTADPRKALTRSSGMTVPSNTGMAPDLLKRAIQVFGARHKAMDWLTSPIAGLGGKVPSDLASSPAGMRKVFDELGRIEHGVF